MQDKMEKHFCANSNSLTRDFGVNVKNKYFDTESRYLFERGEKIFFLELLKNKEITICQFPYYQWIF